MHTARKIDSLSFDLKSGSIQRWCCTELFIAFFEEKVTFYHIFNYIILFDLNFCIRNRCNLYVAGTYCTQCFQIRSKCNKYAQRYINVILTDSGVSITETSMSKIKSRVTSPQEVLASTLWFRGRTCHLLELLLFVLSLSDHPNVHQSVCSSFQLLGMVGWAIKIKGLLSYIFCALLSNFYFVLFYSFIIVNSQLTRHLTRYTENQLKTEYVVLFCLKNASKIRCSIKA